MLKHSTVLIDGMFYFISPAEKKRKALQFEKNIITLNQGELVVGLFKIIKGYKNYLNLLKKVE